LKIIFLDIDGVLNSVSFLDSKDNQRDELRKYYKENIDNIDFEEELNLILKRRLLDIDFNKLDMIIEVCKITNSKVVIISTWKIYEFWNIIKEYLINYGLPIIDETIDYKYNRGKEIREYLENHKEIDKYVIIDDEYFKDYKGLDPYLVQTDYYKDGFNEEHKKLVLSKLR